MLIQSATFMSAPPKKPTKENKPDLSALALFPARSSPITAPRNGPNKIPKGGKTNNPAIIPIVLPLTPDFVPPEVLTAHIGSK